MKIVIEGRIQTGKYTNKEGQTVYTTDVVAESVEFAESKSATSGNNNKSKPAKSDNYQGMDEDGWMSIPDDVNDEGLPFN